MATDCSALTNTMNTSIQVVAIVVGWIVVHRLSVSRDLDKARREMLAKAADDLSVEVSDLVSLAKEYHKKSRDRDIEDQIKMGLQDISNRTSQLLDVSKNRSEVQSCSISLVALKKAITGTHFEDEHVEALQLGDALIQNITLKGLAVRRSFVQLKHYQFPP